MIEILSRQFASVGGPVLVALLLISIAALAATIVKIMQFSHLGVGRHRTARAALAKWVAGDHETASRLAASDNAALSRVVAVTMTSLTRWPSESEKARDLATHEAIETLNTMTSQLRLLEAIVQAAPMLGLLGTVIGMIDAFGKLSQGGGAVDPGALAGGIWIALATTAIGLTIAIPFYFVSMWLESRVDRERAAMDSAISGIINRASGPAPTTVRPFQGTRAVRTATQA